MKLRIIFLLAAIVNLSITSFAQSDTLLINNEKIACSVKEISGDEVKFAYAGEETITSAYRNTVQKITFKNGRVQTFPEATSFKTVTNVDQYENVSMTAVPSEVKGLFKLGDVSSKAKGGTTLSNQERVKQRAYKKMKIEAAMMGANIVYLTNQRSEGNRIGGRYNSSTTAETTLTGVAYSNQLPSMETFTKLINNRSNFVVFEEDKLWSNASDVKKTTTYKELKVSNITNDNGIVTIEGQLPGATTCNKFRLVNVTNEYFSVYYKDKNTAYSYKVRL